MVRGDHGISDLPGEFKEKSRNCGNQRSAWHTAGRQVGQGQWAGRMRRAGQTDAVAQKSVFRGSGYSCLEEERGKKLPE